MDISHLLCGWVHLCLRACSAGVGWGGWNESVLVKGCSTSMHPLLTSHSFQKTIPEWMNEWRTFARWISMRAKVQPDCYCLLHLVNRISYCLDWGKPWAPVTVPDFLFPIPHCRGRRVLPEGFDPQLCGGVDHREGRSDHRPAAERDWSHHQTVKIQRLLPRWVTVHWSPQGCWNCSVEELQAVISDCVNRLS